MKVIFVLFAFIATAYIVTHVTVSSLVNLCPFYWHFAALKYPLLFWAGAIAADNTKILKFMELSF